MSHLDPVESHLDPKGRKVKQRKDLKSKRRRATVSGVWLKVAAAVGTSLTHLTRSLTKRSQQRS